MSNHDANHAGPPPEGAPTDQYLERVYHELHAIAESFLRQQHAHTLQATGLVHEAYLRLAKRADEPWENRRHFFFAAARAMRDILVEHHRKRSRRQNIVGRRIDAAHVTLMAPEEQVPVDILALHDALERLEAESEAKANLVMLRFFAGLTIAQIADVLDRSTRSVERDWRFVRAWLLNELADA